MQLDLNLVNFKLWICKVLKFPVYMPDPKYILSISLRATNILEYSAEVQEISGTFQKIRYP